MKNVTLTFLFVSVALTGFSTTWTVTTPGFEFSPATLTIAAGDTVIFAIGNIHTVLQVNEGTWNANGTTPLAGGFSLPLGGGMLIPDDLPVGTHFYVCEPHGSMGMKGRIIVEGTSALEENHLPSSITVFPNPSQGKLYLSIDDKALLQNFDLEIYDALGKNVLSMPKSDILATTEIDLSNFANGIYFIKLYKVVPVNASFTRTPVYSKKIVIQ